MDGNAGQGEPHTPWEFKPGDTVTPNQSAADAQSAPVADTPRVSLPAPEPTAPPVVSEPLPEEREIPAAQTPQPSMQSSDGSISWTASEYIAHHKSAGWYGALAAVALLLAAVVFVTTRDTISTGVVLFGAIVLGGYAARKPQQLQYRMDYSGLTIGQRYYDLNGFRSFYVVQEGAFSSITFLPLKRFAPMLTVYYDPADEDKILDLLSESLPMERREHDVIENFMRRIRF